MKPVTLETKKAALAKEKERQARFPSNIPLTFNVKLVMAGEKVPYYSRSWGVSTLSGGIDTERLGIRMGAANALKAQCEGSNLVEWKAATGALRVSMTTSKPVLVCYPVFEPTSNEFGEVAP